MVGIHQLLPGDDAVPVGVRVAGKGQVEVAAHVEQAAHGIGRGAVHADLAVLVAGHKAEGWVHLLVHHGQVDAVGFRNGFPEGQARAAERVHAELEARGRDGLHVQHLG